MFGDLDPDVDLVRVCSIDHVGEPLSAAHPHLEGATDLVFLELSPREAALDVDVVLLDFLLPDSVWAVPVEGSADSVDVRVLTHDNWTTSPVVAFESAGGKAYGSFSLTERKIDAW
jgi:N-acetyl-gamma-glutamylphosphate reductase